MSKENNGGPAFPTQGYEGVTLRDYFAAKCMAAIIGTLNGPVTGEEYPGDFEYYAECAYKMSDGMLKAREES